MTREERIKLFVSSAQNAGFDLEEANKISFNLDMLGFFTAPASTKYHGNYEGGLFDHSYEVMKNLCTMTDKNDLKWFSPRSPFIVGMFHDLCKCDSYVRSESTPVSWTYRDGSPWGSSHGLKSAAIAGTLIQLTPEEVICIIHHMGAYEKDSWQNYDTAIRMYPNVLWTHQADMIASKVVSI